MLPIRIQDARDQTFDLFEPSRKSYLLSYDREKTGMDAVREVSRTKRGPGAWRIIRLSLVGIFIGFLLLSAAIDAVNGRYGFGIFMGVILSLSFGELVIRRWYRRWRHREAVLRAMVMQGLCGSCGYELHGINSSDDGCIVCPECGAAWRTDKRRRDEHPRWERPFPWLSKFVYDDRGWKARPRFGIRASAIGRDARRKRLLLCASGPLGMASYVVGWLVFPVLIGMLVLLFVFANPWFVLFAIVGSILTALSRAIIWAIARAIRAEDMRTALLDVGNCVCCDDELFEKPEPDGLHACGNCGSAWLIPPRSTAQ